MSPKLDQLENESKKSVEHFKRDIGKLRTGRAHPSLLDSVQVDYYGSSVPLIQLGLVNAPESRLLTVQVYDGGAVEAVEKAIQQADLGLNPSREGALLRIAIPALNEERRKEFIKKLNKMAEEAKIVLRNHRRDAIDNLKKQEKDRVISADDVRKGQEQVQKIVDKHIGEIDTLVTAKEKEIMEV